MLSVIMLGVAFYLFYFIRNVIMLSVVAPFLKMHLHVRRKQPNVAILVVNFG
jgi:hypothetical protein